MYKKLSEPHLTLREGKKQKEKEKDHQIVHYKILHDAQCRNLAIDAIFWIGTELTKLPLDSGVF
jgi:hypothetical protein